MKVSVSFLSNNYKPDYIIKKVNNTNADYLHVDIMDGKFVKEKTYTLSEIKKYNDISNKKLDIHLMTNNPVKYIDELALLNTEYITFHYEAVKNISEMISYIKSFGIKVGISINPSTDVTNIFQYLKDLDQVLIMSVNPGASGQTFMEGVLYKIEVLRKEIDINNLKTIISVDGGINEETSVKVKNAGVNMVVSASFLHNEEITKRIEYLKNL